MGHSSFTWMPWDLGTHREWESPGVWRPAGRMMSRVPQMLRALRGITGGGMIEARALGAELGGAQKKAAASSSHAFMIAAATRRHYITLCPRCLGLSLHCWGSLVAASQCRSTAFSQGEPQSQLLITPHLLTQTATKERKWHLRFVPGLWENGVPLPHRSGQVRQVLHPRGNQV